jgi:Flp pilus assembly protein TadG
MLLARFWNNRKGGVAPLLAFAIVPLIGAVGVAIDYTQVNSVRDSLQAALDSTALMISKNAALANEEDLNAEATTFVKAMFTQQPKTENLQVNAVFATAGGSNVKVTGTAIVKTNFLGILGYGNIPISASATSTWGNIRLRVALVLDNTGSMGSSGKMDALKTAAQNLLDQLKKATQSPEDAYVSIIPFNKDVNIGGTNYGQPWLRWDLWEEVNGSCSNTTYKTKSSCVSHSKVWTAANHNTWNGCLTDRDQNFDSTNDAPVAGGTLYPTEQYSSCPVQIMGLSNDWTALAAKLTAMTPVGNTNQGIGLQMGWQSLTASPFTIPPKDSNYQYKEIVILLSDGLNTEDRWYTSASSIDAREKKTCDNIKAADITIYSIQVNTGGDPTSAILQDCASDSSKFFLLTSSDAIVTTFGQIATALTNLRLSM